MHRKRLFFLITSTLLVVLIIALPMENKEYNVLLQDGVYETEAEGHGGLMVVSTTIADGKITSVEILSHRETMGLSDDALKLIPLEIVSRNSLKVDTISGATLSSNAILTAVKAAIEQAGGSPEVF